MCNVSDSVAKAGDTDVNDDDLEDDKCPDAGEPSVSLAHLVDAVGGLPVGPRRASGSLVGGRLYSGQMSQNIYLDCE